MKMKIGNSLIGGMILITKKMKSIETIVKQIIIENNLEDEFLFAKINEIWKKQLSSYTDDVRISKYKNKVLYLKTDSSAWRKEITMQKNTIINQLNYYLKENLIEKIII